jgi:MFS transporter, DHA1 family, multidrug resistance protein
MNRSCRKTNDPAPIPFRNRAATLAPQHTAHGRATGQCSVTASYAARNADYWRRNLAVCVFGSFTTLVSLSMLLPFLPLYVRQLGVSSQSAVVEWSGIAFSATFLGTAVTAPLWGRLADRYGRKPMLIRAAIGMAVTMSLIGLAHNVWELVALRFAAGLIGGYASASTVMVATQAPPSRAGWALGLLSTGVLAGNLAGPLIGGVLPPFIGIRGTFFVGGGAIAVAALFTIFMVRENFCPAADDRPRQSATNDGQTRTNPIVVAALLITAMMVLLANMSLEPIITVYISQLGVMHAHLTQIAGLVMACSAFGSLLTAARLGALADQIGGWRVIAACLALTGLVMLPQAFVTSWWQLALLRGVMGMTLAGLLPAIAKLMRHAVAEAHAGKMLGYLQSAQFTGQVAGPILGGIVAVHAGLHAVFIATGLLLMACAGATLWVKTRQPNC